MVQIHENRCFNISLHQYFLSLPFDGKKITKSLVKYKHIKRQNYLVHSRVSWCRRMVSRIRVKVWLDDNTWTSFYIKAMPSIWLVTTSTNAQELINSVTQNLTQYEQIYAGKFATRGSTFEMDLKSSLVSNLRGTLRIANYIWLNNIHGKITQFWLFITNAVR